MLGYLQDVIKSNVETAGLEKNDLESFQYRVNEPRGRKREEGARRAMKIMVSG